MFVIEHTLGFFLNPAQIASKTAYDSKTPQYVQLFMTTDG